MNRATKVGIVCILTIHFILLNIATATAESLSIGSDSPVLSITTSPGVTFDTPIQLQNFSDLPVTLSVRYYQFSSADTNDGKVIYVPTDSSTKKVIDSLSIWENDSPVPTITLAGKQTKSIQLHGVILPTAEKRDYYISVLFVSDATSPSTLDPHSSYLQIHGALATNLLLSVGENSSPVVAVDEFTTTHFSEHGPIPFNVKVSNSSRYRIKPQGTIRITNMFGQYIGKVLLDQKTILAGTSRYLPSQGITPEAQQNNTALWSEPVLIGPYSATVTISVPNTNVKIARTTYFFVMPYKALGSLFLVIMIVSAIIIKVRKRIAG